MLISYPHQFIFIKTVKTAGTSVEGLLQPFCTPPGHPVHHHTPTLLSAYGVVARRGPATEQPDHGYTNHMAAAAIRARFPAFDHYRRFTVVRDPYDRAVSWFHFQAQQTSGAQGLALEQAAALQAEGRMLELRQAFLRFVQQQGVPQEQQRLCIDGQLAVQRWLRFEALVPDLEALFAAWQLPLPSGGVAANLPRFKVLRNASGRQALPLEAYLSQESVAAINGLCSWSFATFDYPQRDPNGYPSIGDG